MVGAAFSYWRSCVGHVLARIVSDMEPDEEPCRQCGSPVRIRTQQGEMSVADMAPPTIRKRVCTNQGCISNQREQPMNAVV